MATGSQRSADKRPDSRPPRRRGRSGKQRKARRKRKNMVFRIVCCVLICAVIILAPTVFFRVSQVEIIGDTRYPASDLITTSGVKEGDNLFFLDSSGIERKLQDAYPYLDQVTIRRKPPSTLHIEVTERTPALSVEQKGKYLLIDMTGKVLDCVKTKAPDTVEVIGAHTDKLVPGSVLQEEHEKIGTVIEMMVLMDQYDMADKVRAVDIGKAFEVKMQYADQYIVLLGDLSNLEHKIQFLQAILKESSLPDTGIIDLTDDEKAHYRPGDVSSFREKKPKDDNKPKPQEQPEQPQTEQPDGETELPEEQTPTEQPADPDTPPEEQKPEEDPAPETPEPQAAAEKKNGSVTKIPSGGYQYL